MPRRGSGRFNKVETLQDFLKYTRMENDCLVWVGHRYPKTKYGQCYYGAGRGRWHGAHRVIWMLVHGSIPQGKWVLHHCDNPPCVRLDHLFLGSPSDNSKDMASKARHYCGTRHHKCTTTPAVVREIRAAYDASRHRVPVAELARQYQLTFTTVYQIVTRQSWRHLR